jgi:putative radical SAM enzyme (TIGR03279 family)
MSLLIEAVAPGSIADEFGVCAGDRLLSVNGQSLRDLIDYSYFTASEEELLLEVEKADGELWELEVQRSVGESLGLTFYPPPPSRCANNCLFCFVHQLPKGLRKPLYVKDEDYRLSFLNGNYVTLANLTKSELKRIVDQHLSPLYVSVHATNPELRERLLGKPGIPPILPQLHLLARSGIVVHTQVVLCPGMNDGEELMRTVTELAGLYPAVRSLAVVPLGLTAHRSKLPQLTPVDAEYARQFLGVWQLQAEKLRRKLRHPFLFLADEFYLKAGEPFPPLKEYGDFPQVENGVGMVPLFLKEATSLLRRVKPIGSFRATVVTGVSSFSFVGDFITQCSEKTGVEIALRAVENRLFGASITVSGLVAGRDIIASLAGYDVGACLLVPDVMLKEGEGFFLDDVTLAELELNAGCPVVVFEATPEGFYRALKGFDRLLKKQEAGRVCSPPATSYSTAGTFSKNR